MQLYNSLTNQLEKFAPLNPPEVKLYACGPTVYDYAHLGHLRKYCMDDVLRRTLINQGYQVTHVQNVTDVGHLASDADTGEDKIEKGARKYSLDVHALAQKFEDYFYYSMDLMNNLRPTVICRATEHIQEMLQLVETLEEKGYTYVIEGDGVYFDTGKLDDYGQLAGIDPDELQEGARVEKVPGKRNLTDFALWKFERPNENRAMAWSSKWHERSFPGWHIECSAMSMKYLGEQIDIHTGGIDHIPVHHTNEIAQSEAATGKKPFCKYWVHHNFLLVEGEKMSKSKGNFYTIDDVLAKDFSPLALRLLFLSAHYRKEMNFTWENLAGAQKSWVRLKKLTAGLKTKQDEQLPNERPADQLPPKPSAQFQHYQTEFKRSLARDINTPEALAVLWSVVKDEQLGGAEKLELLLQFGQVLGLDLAKVEKLQHSTDSFLHFSKQQLPAKIQSLLKKRQQARQNENFDQADQLRRQLSQLGYKVEDTAQGQRIIKQKSSH